MSFTFTWPHPADEVYVTGTFDNWAKTIKLDKKGSVHEKTVPLPAIDGKILYKFVADGVWKNDHEAKSETDHEGNVNNVLYPADIQSSAPEAAILSSVAPGASTTAMAGEQPLASEKAQSSEATTAAAAEDEGLEKVSAPGAFPETPANEFSVNPLPAAEGAVNPIHLAPGEKVPDASTLTNNTITSGVHDDPELKSGTDETERTVGISPFPATGGIGNPVHLAPGEKVPDPSTITGNTLTSNVKLDEESYEKSDAGPPVLPTPLSPQGELEAAGVVPIFGNLGPQTTNIIPESSLPMGQDTPAPITTEDTGPTISSVAPQSTTNELAGQQPIQHHIPPTVVTESQKEAGADPEASASPRAVQEKDEVENELHSKVMEVEPAAESPADTKSKKDTVVETVTGGLAGVGAAAAGAAIATRGKVTETTGKDPVSVLPEPAQNHVDKYAPAGEDQARETTDVVPEEVTTSQKEAGVEPEATTNPEAVKDKESVEKEILKVVPESEAQGEPAPTESAALSTTAPTSSAPAEGLNAPASEPAIPPSEKVDAAPVKPTASGDVSPLTKPDTSEAEPTVTTGVETTATPTESKPADATAHKRHSIIDRFISTPESHKSGESAEGKEKKKGGFFSKLRDRFK